MLRLTKQEKQARNLARRIINHPEFPDLIFIGGHIKGQFYKRASADQIGQLLYSWLRENAMEGKVNAARLIARTMAILRKNCRIHEINLNPYEIYTRNTQRFYDIG